MRALLRPVLMMAVAFALWYGLIAALTLTGLQAPLDLGWWRFREAPAAGGAGSAGGAEAVAAPQPTATPVDTSRLAGPDSDPTPALPERVFAVVGQPFYVYFDPLVLGREPDEHRVEVICDCGPGSSERRRWGWTPQAADEGQHRLRVVVRDWRGRSIAVRDVKLVVHQAPRDVGPLELLLTGASITHQSAFPNRVSRAFEAHGWSVRFVGSHHPVKDMDVRETALPGVYHEGYGGWTWERFLTHYKPGEEKTYYVPRSPFVFAGPDGTPRLDVGRYLREQKAEGLDLAIFDLGINETFNLDPDDGATFAPAIAKAVDDARTMLRAFHAASPQTELGVILPVPFTRSPVTFEHAYGKYSRALADPWRHRRVQHRLTQAFIAGLDASRLPRVTLIPVHVGFDVVDGYWIHDAVHPNPFGAQLYANSIFAWIVDRVESRNLGRAPRN